MTTQHDLELLRARLDVLSNHFAKLWEQTTGTTQYDGIPQAPPTLPRFGSAVEVSGYGRAHGPEPKDVRFEKPSADAPLTEQQVDNIRRSAGTHFQPTVQPTSNRVIRWFSSLASRLFS